MNLFGSLDLRTFGPFLPPGRFPDGRPMRTALLFIRPGNLAPLRAALEAQAVLGVQDLDDTEGAEDLALAGLVLLRGRLRIPIPDNVGKGEVLVLVVEGTHSPASLEAMTRASIAALRSPVVEVRPRIVLPGGEVL